MIGRVFHQIKLLSKKFSRQNLYEWMKDEAVQLDPCAEILNIGSGGPIFKALNEMGLRPKQVDIDPDRRPDIVADLCDLHMIEDNSVDAVFAMEVLEHINTPEKRLVRCGAF